MTIPASSLLNNADFVQSCEQFIQTRHSIHAHPELGSEVPNTAQLVAKLLQEWGDETHTQVGGHGVVGVLKHGSSERSIGIRADMDALPIQENTGLPYASTIDGRMHACGHDGHTAILLASAHYLAQHKPFDGTVNLIFQPYEEGLSGAQAMIDDGLFERFPCDAIFALHNMPGKEVGLADVRSGIFSASSDKVTIRLTGKGGHAALPHLSADVTIAIGHIILGLQSIVSRNISPSDQSIVSIGQIQAGTTPNVIPNDAMMTLSVRNFSQQNQDLIERRIREIVAGQCRAFGIQGEVEYLRQGGVDFAITSQIPVIDSALDWQAICRIPNVVVTRKSHPLCNTRSLRALHQSEWVTLDAPDDPNTYHYQLFAVNGLPIPSRIRECTSMTLARSLIQTADLAALFSTESLELDYIKNEFAVVPLLDNIPDSVISVVRPKRDIMTQSAMDLFERILQDMRDIYPEFQ